MGKCTERLYNGIVKENPTFVQMLGMCPTLAVTSSAINGAGMGLSTTCILVLSNAFISLLRKVIPEKVRIPSYIVIIASFVTVIQFLMQAYLPSLNDSLGIYIPLIVVNCLILARAEAFAVLFLDVQRVMLLRIKSFRQFLMDLEWDLDLRSVLL